MESPCCALSDQALRKNDLRRSDQMIVNRPEVNLNPAAPIAIEVE